MIIEPTVPSLLFEGYRFGRDSKVENLNFLSESDDLGVIILIFSLALHFEFGQIIPSTIVVPLASMR